MGGESLRLFSSCVLYLSINKKYFHFLNRYNSSGPQSGTSGKWGDPQSGTKKRGHQKHVPLGILALLLLRSDAGKTSI